MSSQTRPTALAALSILALTGAAGAQPKVFTGLASPAMYDEDFGAYGRAVTSVPDLNGDGKADFVIAASTQTAGGKNDAGRVFVYSGADFKFIRAIISPEPQNLGYFGRSVAGIGDVTGDGKGDIVIGAPREQGSPDGFEDGCVYIMNGATGKFFKALISPEDYGSYTLFGITVAVMPDINGDGFQDIAVGAPDARLDGKPSQSGAVHIYSGKTGACLKTIDPPSPEEHGSFGYSVAGLPDVNGDGKGDIAVGCLYYGGTDAGAAYVISGASGKPIAKLVSPGAEPDGGFGCSIAGLPDVNGDGKADVIVGAYLESPGSDPVSVGRAYIFSAKNGTLIRKVIPPLKQTGANFGAAVASCPDLNGDACADIIVGSPGMKWADKAAGSGAVHVYSGKTGVRLFSFGSPNSETGGDFGLAVAGLKDVTGDGKGEIIVGARYEDPGNAPYNSGRAYIIR